MDAASEAAGGRLRRVVQHRHRPQDDDRRARGDRPASSSASTPSRSSRCRARRWDSADWFANSEQARAARSAGSRGPARATACSDDRDWYRGLPDNPERYAARPRSSALDTEHSVTAIDRLLQRQPGHPDHVPAAEGDVHQAEHGLRDHLRQRLQPRRQRGGDPRHLARTTGASSGSRTRGTSARRRRSAAAWSSRRKNACVLLDGDLQDPPELIEQFVARWREGYDVVYGRRGQARGDCSCSSPTSLLPGLRSLLVPLDPARRR